MNFFSQMIWIDFVVLAIIGFYALLGLIRGARKESLSLLSWLLAIVLAWCFALEFSEYLGESVRHPIARLGSAFVCLIILTRMFTSVFFFLKHRGDPRMKISWFEHTAGIVIGGMRGAVVVIAIIVLMALTTLPKDPWWRESQMLPLLQTPAVWLKHHIPSGMAGFVHFG